MASEAGQTVALTHRKPAMIVVDMQNAFLHDQGSVATMGLDITYMKETVAPVARLVQTCHDTNIPIIFTRYVLRADYTDAGLREERRPGACASGSLVSGSWDANLDPRMDVRDTDYILDKTRYSSFYNTNLEVILRGLQVDTLIVCGVTTEICVDSTIRDAYFRDFRILVPHDAVAATDIERHHGTLRTIEYGFGTVTTTNALIDALQGAAPSDRNAPVGSTGTARA